MKQVLEVQGLCKEYPSFRLEKVSFAMESGSIMGFVGANGAGKSTTMKCMLNLCHPSAGSVRFFGMAFSEHEREIKSRIGYAPGGVDWYPRRKLREIADVTKAFYPHWEDGLYRRYLERFGLDENKKPIELSQGMKVKFSLALALSHRAELLILDEPTSGLDPVSREDLLELFLDLAGEGMSIFFSTHIISDLDKCADQVTYIQKGKVLRSERMQDFVNAYRIIWLPENLEEVQKQAILGISRSRKGRTGLILSENAGAFPGIPTEVPDLESVMVHLEKGEELA